MKVRTLIVDDMLLARERIKRFLKSDPEVEVVGECSDGREAVSAIKELAPDLVFLDVQIPELDGFGVLDEVNAAQMPVVIFITAYDEFAIRAFEVHALDYLLKPFNRDRMRDALLHAKAHLAQRNSREVDRRLDDLLKDIKGDPKHIKRLAIKSSGRIVFLMTDEIDRIESAGNYVCVYAGKDNHLLRERLSQLETRLDPARFIRIHRSTIINVDRVKELQPLFNGDYRVILRDGTELTLSRNYREKFMGILENPS